jgi:tRNA(Ile)-lysidine synthase
LVHPLEEVSQPVVVIESIPYSITTASYSLSIEACSLKDADISRQQKEEYLSASGIEFPLLVRSWKAGDYFYPLGMPKKKKVARFLTDLKVSLHEKQHQFVLESNQKIIAVLGKRIDDRFKLLPTAQTALKISFKAHSE